MILYVKVSPSGSEASIVPSTVPFALFSDRVKVAAVIVGATFSSTSVKLIVTIAESLKAPSETSIPKLKVGIVSKSSAELVDIKTYAFPYFSNVSMR